MAAREKPSNSSYDVAPTVAIFAAVHGVSTTMAHRWVRAGMPRLEDGGFRLADTIRWRIDTAVRKERAKHVSKEERGEQLNWTERATRATALTKEKQLEVLDEQWLRAEDVRRLFGDRAKLIADGLEQLPYVVAQRVEGLRGPEIVEAVQELARKLREGYSQGDVVALLKEWARMAGKKQGGPPKKGRGRPRKP